MSESSKKAARVNGGYNGKTGYMGEKTSYITGGLLGQDGTGFSVDGKGKENFVAQNIRADTSDTLKRRQTGFRGL